MGDVICAKLWNLPNHFDDDFIHGIVLKHKDGVLQNVYEYSATLGLVVKIKKALKRLVRRQKVDEPLGGDYSLLLHAMVKILTNNAPVIDTWTPAELLHVTYLLEEKSTVLSGQLFSSMDKEPLYPPIDMLLTIPNLAVQSNFEYINKLLFRKSFIDEINRYHSSLKRPIDNVDTSYSEDMKPVTSHADGEEEDNSRSEAELLKEVIHEDNRIVALSTIERDICSQCKGRRQIYCGACGGIRMNNAIDMLPNRINLPFDVLLVLHWQESLHKCTGIHSRVLALDGQVSYAHWYKNQWQALVASFTPRDVLLFPSEEAMDASMFPWEDLPCSHTSSSSNTGTTGRYRLVVLESSWNYGLGMAKQIMEYRKQMQLPPLICIKLNNIVGKYWRFQEVGHAAVSTIEAIAYAAMSARTKNNKPSELDESFVNDLLLLFRLQKYRVLNNIVTNGTKAPRAMVVYGEQDASWKDVNVIDTPDVDGVLDITKLTGYVYNNKI